MELNARDFVDASDFSFNEIFVDCTIDVLSEFIVGTNELVDVDSDDGDDGDDVDVHGVNGVVGMYDAKCSSFAVCSGSPLVASTSRCSARSLPFKANISPDVENEAPTSISISSMQPPTTSARRRAISRLILIGVAITDDVVEFELELLLELELEISDCPGGNLNSVFGVVFDVNFADLRTQFFSILFDGDACGEGAGVTDIRSVLLPRYSTISMGYGTKPATLCVVFPTVAGQP